VKGKDEVGVMGIAGTTRVYGVIGDPVAHSLSPFIMNRAFAACGLDACYVAFPVRAGRLTEALAGLKHAGVAGANVTYPHKEGAFLACETSSERASLLRAANTLVFTAGALRAENTDAPGTALALETFGVPPAGLRALILGAGGAGRAAALGLLEAGASRVTLAVRDVTRGEAAVAGLRDHFGADRVRIVTDGGLAEAAGGADAILNATPVGMSAEQREDPPQPGDVALIDPSWIRSGQICFDFVYHPLETPFLAAARTRGARCIDGLALLAAQARESFAIWTGCGFDLRPMHAAAAEVATSGREG
jgi:shikimate dehydrogenase